MRSIFVIFILLMAQGFGQQVSLEWDANTEPDLAGYHMYRDSGEGLGRITDTSITITTYTDTELSPATVYTYAATALNDSGLESEFSNQVRWAYTLRGDSNLSGAITVSDAVAVMRHTSGVELLTGLAFLAADANGDGNISISDAVAIMRHTSGLEELSGTVSMELVND